MYLLSRTTRQAFAYCVTFDKFNFTSTDANNVASALENVFFVTYMKNIRPLSFINIVSLNNDIVEENCAMPILIYNLFT
jgi:hypothetical protein